MNINNYKVTTPSMSTEMRNLNQDDSLNEKQAAEHQHTYI